MMYKINTFLLAMSISTSAYASLPNINLDISKISVSGLSSGGYMATQFHFAYSDWVTGAGVIAAGPYYCAQNDIKIALANCVNKVSNLYELDALKQTVEDAAEQQKIAPVSHLQNSKVWLLHGTKDQKIAGPVNQMLYQQYSAFVAPENIKYVDSKPFSHHFPTVDKGSECSVSEPPFIGHCDYDAASEMLGHITGKTQPKAASASGKLHTFNQQELGGKAASSLADEGFLYIPKACATGQPCHIHVSFHGCNQNAEAVGSQYASNTGINQWADSNNMLVLYPQTKKSLFMPLNPQACWDWWGYTDDQYASKNGQQLVAVKNMLNSLAHSKGAHHD